jgi:hypothetical protein
MMHKLTALSLALMFNSTPTQAAIPGDIQPCWQGSTMFFLIAMNCGQAFLFG